MTLNSVNEKYSKVERKVAELKQALYELEAEYTPVDVDLHQFVTSIDSFMFDLDMSLPCTEAELAGVL